MQLLQAFDELSMVRCVCSRCLTKMPFEELRKTVICQGVRIPAYYLSNTLPLLSGDKAIIIV